MPYRTMNSTFFEPGGSLSIYPGHCNKILDNECLGHCANKILNSKKTIWNISSSLLTASKLTCAIDEFVVMVTPQ